MVPLFDTHKSWKKGGYLDLEYRIAQYAGARKRHDIHHHCVYHLVDYGAEATLGQIL